ncbi:hypothetical protein AB1I63_00985 [Streptococcus pneumoniae]
MTRDEQQTHYSESGSPDYLDSQDILVRQQARLENERLEHKFAVMADLENDIEIRKREKVLVMVVMATVTLVLLLSAFLVRPDQVVSMPEISQNSVSSSSVSSSELRSETSLSRSEEPSSSTLEKVTTSTQFQVEVDRRDLTIRRSPSEHSANLGMISPGIYTIIATQQGENYQWGKLKSGEGWIALDYTNPISSQPIGRGGGVNTKDLTTEQVRKWVAYDVTSKNHVTPAKIDVQMGPDHLVYADVHLSDRSEVAYQYRVSSNGCLEKKVQDYWQVSLETYME